MEKLILIDGNSLINRAYYATPPLSNSEGLPTNAVYGFMNMLLRLVTTEKPTHMLVAFDRKAPTFRHKMFDGYKALRKPMPDDLASQMPILKEVLSSLKITMYEADGIEADDIIGAAAKKFAVPTYIISGDRDEFQLVDDTTTVWFTRRGITDIDEYNIENFKEKTGITPIQLIDLKACMGDASDNIPGIKGVGEKTALTLIQTYGTVENIYANIEELKGALKTKVEDSRDMCILSKTLATINTNVPLPIKLSELEITFPFSAAAKERFIHYGFRSLSRREGVFLTEEIEDEPKTEIETAIPGEEEIAVLFDRNISVYDKDGLREIKIKENFFDDGEEYEEVAHRVLSDKNKKYIVFDKKALKKSLPFFDFPEKSEDVMLLNYVLDSTRDVERADDLFFINNKEKNAKSLYEIYFDIKGRLSDRELKLYREVELPLADVLYGMEKEGFKIDEKQLNALAAKYEGELTELGDAIHAIEGAEKLNINSPKQIGELLTDKYKIKLGKKTKTGYSVTAEVLEKASNEHEIIPLLLRYRKIQKLQSTYLEGFKPYIDKATGVTHTTFLQTKTTTGRLSSKEPNLQNIPVRVEEAREIRKCFVPKTAGNLLVSADYSQIELRLLAHFSECEPLIDAYKNGEDIHALTASKVFNVPLDKVDSEMRRSAKAVNFGIIYGIGDYGLSNNIKTSVRSAGEFIKRYFETYPRVKEYMDENVAFARKNGYVETLLGRKRYFKDINSSNFNLRSYNERAAMNMPLQGTSADIIKLAMINVDKRLIKEKLKAKLILQVHDELIVDCPQGELDEVKALLKEEMENAVSLRVPLIASVACGKSWFDAK